MLVDLIDKSEIVLTIMILDLIDTNDCDIVEISMFKPQWTTQLTASATMSQETLKATAVSFQDILRAQWARKAANCLITGDLPVDQGTCSTTTLLQILQSTRRME